MRPQLRSLKLVDCYGPGLFSVNCLTPLTALTRLKLTITEEGYHKELEDYAAWDLVTWAQVWAQPAGLEKLTSLRELSLNIHLQQVKLI